MSAKRKYYWRVSWAEWATGKLTRLLADGWEPFGANDRNIWLRKRSLVKDPA